MPLTSTEVSSTVGRILRDLLASQADGVDVERELQADSSLRELGVDSFSLVHFVSTVEDQFDIQIDDDDLDPASFATVGTVCDLVARYVNGPAPANIGRIGRPGTDDATAGSDPGADATEWAAAGREAELLWCTARVGMSREHVGRALWLLARTDPRLDWGVFMDLATRHRVLGLVASNFDRERLGPIGTVRRSVLRAFYLYNQGRAQAWNRERRQLLAAFVDDGVRPIVRKGSYLAQHAYPDPAMRYMEDMDLYVAADEVAQVTATLERLGYQQGTDSVDRRTVGPLDRRTELFWRFNVSALPPFLRPTSDPYVDVFSVDVRRDLMEPASGKSVPAEHFLARASRVSLSGERAWVPSAEDMLLDLVVHLHREATTLSSIRSGKDLCLIRFVDVIQWYRHTVDRLDTDVLTRLAKEYDVAAEVYYGLHFADQLSPGVLSPDLLRQFRPDDLSYLDTYGRLDGVDASWPVDFRNRMFDRHRIRHVQELSALPRPRRQW
jgi:acyl carrier protein